MLPSLWYVIWHPPQTNADVNIFLLPKCYQCVARLRIHCSRLLVESQVFKNNDTRAPPQWFGFTWSGVVLSLQYLSPGNCTTQPGLRTTHRDLAQLLAQPQWYKHSERGNMASHSWNSSLVFVIQHSLSWWRWMLFYNANPLCGWVQRSQKQGLFTMHFLAWILWIALIRIAFLWVLSWDQLPWKLGILVEGGRREFWSIK